MDTIRSLTGVLVLFVFATLAACGGGGGGGGGGEPIRSSDATLIGLSISAGTLTPGFSTTTLVYSVAVNNATGSVTVTPSATSATATIRVNSVVTASGSPSAAITLAVGTNVIGIVVTAEDGTAATAYTITVTRQIPPSSDANLSNLTVSSGTLAPPFSPATIAYTNLVPMASDSINVVATVADAGASMTINDAAVSSGVLTAVPVPVGQSTITIEVAALDATTKNYTIAVTRPGITLTPADSNITAFSRAMLTVTLAAVAGGDTSVTLVSSNPAVTVPNDVTVLAGLTQATFSATSISSEGTQATVTATLGVDSPTATVTVTGVDPPVAFRINDLDLRDPHFFVSFLGCRDVTDTSLVGYSFNGELQAGLQTDGNSDGLLDYSPTILFRAFDQDGGTQPVEFYDNPNCTTPLAGTTCSRIGTADITTIATQRAIGQCLSPLPGTTRPYSPAIISPSGPCFVTNPASLTLEIAGIPLTLSSARIGATWVGSPAESMTNGLISGFVSVTQANSTILPSSLPLVGGHPLSRLLPGGTNNCAQLSDRDTNVVQGWWFYWNFTATKVNWVDN